MTDRLKGVVVTFDRDIRDDDAADLIKAIGCIKGVIDVTPSVVDPDDHMNRMRICSELTRKLWDVLHPDLPLRKAD